MIKLRTVTLVGGPCDGAQTVVSHWTAVHGDGHVYVSNGKDSDTRLHWWVDVAALIPDDVVKLLSDYIANPSPVPPLCEAWQLNCMIALHQYGKLP